MTRPGNDDEPRAAMDNRHIDRGHRGGADRARPRGPVTGHADTWTRCAWCWRPLEDRAVVWRRQEPHCSQSCAAHEIVGDAEQGSPAQPVPDDQLALDV